MEREVQRSGVGVVRVPIVPGVFVAWCKARQSKSDGVARSQYAAEILATDAAG
jgi:hypothetical protein